MRPELKPGPASVAQPNIASPGKHFTPGPGAARFEQFSVQVQYLCAPCPFVQVVYILGNYLYLENRFQRNQGLMAGVGFGLKQLPPPLVVEFEHPRWLARKPLWGSYFHYVVAFPEPVCIPKSLQAAVGTYAGPAQHYQFPFQLVTFKAARQSEAAT